MYHGRFSDSILGERVARTSLFVLLAAYLFACAPSLREKASYAIAKRDYPKAIASLEEHLLHTPDDESATCDLLQLYGAVHETEKAERRLASLEEKKAVRAPHLFAMGRAYEFDHAFDRALTAYGQAVERFGARGEVLRDAGFRAARLNDGARAAKWLEQARSLGQRDAELFHALALSLAATEEYPRALETYRACENDPEFGEACTRGIASVALKTRDHALALAAYEKILQAHSRDGASEDRGSKDGGAVLGATWSLIELGRYEEAKKRLLDFQRLPRSRRYQTPLHNQLDEITRRTTGTAASPAPSQTVQ